MCRHPSPLGLPQALEQQILEQLAEQTSAEKGAQRTVHDTKALRAGIQQKEAQLQDLQAQLDKMQAEYENTKVRAGLSCPPTAGAGHSATVHQRSCQAVLARHCCVFDLPSVWNAQQCAASSAALKH